MDQKTWLWRRKSSEKTILANTEEAQSVSMKIMNERLASAVDECSLKDELVQNYKEEAEISAADKRKAEGDLRRLEKELEEARHGESAANDRLGHLNSTLKDRVRQEQDRRMHDAMTKTSQEFERSHKKLEEKLSEASKRLVSLTSENSYLTKALLVKEKLPKDLNSTKMQTEAEFEALMARLDRVEKENAFLRYEFRSLEEELHSKNEELECSRRSLEGSNKNYSENVKKIKNLRGECQRLRSLARRNSICDDECCSEKASKKVSFLIDQVQDLQRENEIFKELLAKKDEEISNLQRPKDLESKERASDDASSEETSSRALVFEDTKTKPESQIIGASEMRLMDEFVEMEKLAVVAVDSPEIKKADDWLQTVTNMVLQQHEASSRSVDELLEDVRMAFSRHPHNKGLKDELSFIRSSSQVPDLKNVSLLRKLAQSRQRIASLESETEKLKESKRTSNDELENLKAMNEELGTQLSVTKAELNQLMQKLNSAEIELDSRSQCCEELEGACQQSENQKNQGGLLQTGMEISKASAKLAECEETMMKLGKQLKALGSSKELSADTKPNLKQRSSLLDQMKSEDNGEGSPKTKEVICSYKATSFPEDRGIKNEARNNKSGALAIVPSKKRGGGGFLRKLLFRRKKSTSIYFGK